MRSALSKFTAFRKIIMPQALIVALRPYGNEIILMIKASAIVAIVTVFDLMGETKYAFSRPGSGRAPSRGRGADGRASPLRRAW